MSEIASLFATIGCKTEGLESGAAKAEGILGKTASTMGTVGKIAGGIALVGVGLLVGGLTLCVKEAMDAQAGIAQLDSVIKSTGGIAGVTRQSVLGMADALQKVTKFADDDVIAADNILLTFTQIGKEVFPQATKTTLDMATALGTDAMGAAMMLGKALNDPIAGVGALRRVGVQLTDAQEKQVKSFMAVNDIASAQKIILGELTTEFGGSAEAAGNTFAGKMAIAGHAIDDVKETIGNALLPILSKAATGLATFLNSGMVAVAADKISGAITDIVGGFDKLGADIAIGVPVGEAVSVMFTNLLQTFGMGQAQATDLGNAIGSVIGFVVSLADGIGKLFADMAIGVPIGQAVAVFITNLGTSLGLSQQQATLLGDAVNGVIGWLQAFGAMISTMAGQVVSDLSGTFSGIAGIITSIIGGLIGLVQSEWAIIVGIIQTNGAAIAANLQGAWVGISTIVGAAVTYIQTIVTTIFGAMQSFLAEHGAEIQAFIGDAWTKISKIISDAVLLIKSIVVPIWTAVGDFIKTNQDTIKAVIEVVWNAIKLVISTVLDVVGGLIKAALAIIKGDWSGAWDAIKGIVEGVWKNILDFFGGIPAKLVEVGKNIIEGLVNGIRSAASSVAAALSGIINDAIAGIKRMLGISSPSKVMEAIGSNMMTGLLQGWSSYGMILPAPDVALPSPGSQSTTGVPTYGNTNTTQGDTWYVTVNDSLAMQMLLDERRRQKVGVWERMM